MLKIWSIALQPMHAFKAHLDNNSSELVILGHLGTFWGLFDKFEAYGEVEGML